ncbi:putative ORFan [Tupanvirus deep ocean]|uniref:ORFan n=2 Tax=Tupanvirus TaxID=2094720 RepID=A0AC62AA35_9VIRU|nr:putative ORFan [Tupanvirus deep ocean]QKU34515.1 putative ORFan [Tupanvirus deep ocean]
MFLLIVIILLYYFYGWSYSKGAAEYARANNNGSSESEDCWQSVCDEYEELKYAVHTLNYWEIFMEFFDVLHASIKFVLVSFFPRIFYFHWLSWAIIFPFVLPASIKLGARYNKYKCIRNHARKNRNHKCLINKHRVL